MKSTVLAAVIALALAPAAHAQTTNQPSGAPPSATAPSAADEAKFKAADKNGNGALEGTETDAFKANMTRIDSNKDGKVTREEFLAAARSGVIR
jgi:opacity protein-like surface antigen